MDKRIKVGIIYKVNNAWIAGTYFILNIIHALYTLSDNQKPHLFIIVNNKKDFEDIKIKTQYPYLEPLLINTNGIMRKINKLFLLLFKRYLFLNKKLLSLDVILPITYNTALGYNCKNSFIYWIPDFQEHYLSHLFSAEEIKMRKLFQIKIIYEKNNILLSSNFAYENLKSIYPGNQANVYVVPFAVSISLNNNLRFETIKDKYQIPSKYYFCPNQFWLHKNHVVILEALKISIENNNPFFVVFTGKTEDYRTSDYFKKICDFIEYNNLTSYVRILGFIDRDEMLHLLANSVALLQPSLFEGWSTTIEEAKALGKPVICSDIPVHHQQLGNKGIYFNANNPHQLYNHIISLNTEIKLFDNYDIKIKEFGINLYKMFLDVKNNTQKNSSNCY
ncbi:MAG TPA: glycosyltransferase family 1 protein [Bacteroidales bacterium]|nr:glycosyltransferase family 1 protein [Bacteroidales bacterium]HPO65937.1 glycosyltransferase family 1 protein [Bacteroidales bacterium]